ncbi:MAG: YiiG family protein [Defluviitaleaceae bacterium]|nr:YiiG family protein [Defluviitaleaceae bacterium]
MKSKLAPVLAVALVFLFLTTGCSSLSNVISGLAGGASPTPGAEDTENSASGLNDPAAVDKHNAYIDLYNNLVDRFDQTIQDYAGEFGTDEQVRIPDDFDGYAMYTTDTGDLLRTAMGYADKAPSEPGADAALKALQPDLASYCQALAGAATYYGDKNYVDDNFAKAQEYHAVIIGDYDALYDKIDAFLSAVDTMLEGQDEQQLAYYQQQNMMVHYWALQSLITAQEMSSYFYGNEISAANIQDISLADFKPLYDNFVAAYTGYANLVNGNDNAGEDEGIFMLDLFTNDLSDLKASASELISMLNSGSVFDDLEISSLASMTDGTPENIADCVSSLLSDYNSQIVG